MKKETLIIHTNAWPILKGLSTEQLGKLFASLMTYQRGEPMPKLDDVTKMAFDFMAAQIDRDNEKYAQIVEKRREAGRKSAAMRSKSQHEPTSATSVNHNDNDNENVNDNDNERYVSLGSLSDDELRDLREEYGDRADGLIEDVQAYYSTHAGFPGWSNAVAQFSRNQRRWGKAEARGGSKSLAEICAELGKEESV